MWKWLLFIVFAVNWLYLASRIVCWLNSNDKEKYIRKLWMRREELLDELQTILDEHAGVVPRRAMCNDERDEYSLELLSLIEGIEMEIAIICGKEVK